ncbi:MAG: hypothetical protein KKD44_10740 [Proteobacteria bacterium]|nr:hypothetical protein [Pseudomonadota bacterium]
MNNKYIIHLAALGVALLFLTVTAMIKLFHTNDTPMPSPASVKEMVVSQSIKNTPEAAPTIPLLPAAEIHDAGYPVTTFDSVADYNTVSAYGPLPDYLSDVGFDGGFEVDDQGKLIIGQDMRRLFDFFLAAVRIEGITLCTARINEYIDLTLPPDAAREARSAWAEYRAYKNRLKGLYQEFSDKRDTDPDTYKTLVLSIIHKHRELRRQCMSQALVQAFFSEDEANEDQALSRIKGPVTVAPAEERGRHS